MILRFFKKPRWQHRDPGVRRIAVEAGRLDQETLLAIIRDDGDSGVRRAVCGKLEHLPTLMNLVATADAGNAARLRLQEILGGSCITSNTLEQRIRQVSSLQDFDLLFALARQGDEVAIRRAALERLTDPGQILAVALDDSASSIRLLAVEMLGDRASLTKVVQHLGKRDKTAYRLARGKLKELTEREAMPAMLATRCQSLCAQLERLGQHGNWAEDRARLTHLEQLWGEMDGPLDALWQNEFETLRSHFLERYAAYRSDNQSKLAAAERQLQRRAEKQALVTRLQEESRGLSAEALKLLIEDCERQWRDLTDGEEGQEPALEQAFSQLQQEQRQHLEQLNRAKSASNELMIEMRRLEAALGAESPLEIATVHQSIKSGQALLDELSAAPHLRERFDTLCQEITARFDAQRSLAHERLQHLPEQLDKLADWLDQGELKRAEGLHAAVRSQCDLIKRSGVSGSSRASSEQRLRELSGKIVELRNWRKWSTDQHREQLCDQIEQLVNSEGTDEAIVDRLRQLQRDWNRLERSASHNSSLLRERFDLAAKDIQRRCQTFLEAQAELRHNNRLEKEALCAQLEDFLKTADWEQIDWKKAVKAERETRAAWRRTGEVSQRYHRALESRFRRGQRKIESRFAQERKQNLAFRRGLITRMKTLIENSDSEQSITEARKLQQQWHTTVTASRAEENRIWQEFRTAADQVFERHRNSQQLEQRQLEHNLEQRRLLCQRLSALGETAGEEDIEQLERAADEIHELWRESSNLALPKKQQEPLEIEWQSAQAKIRQRIDLLLTLRAQTEVAALGIRAGLCHRLETAPNPGDMATLAEVEKAWNEAPEIVSSADREIIEQRYRTARYLFDEPVKARETLLATQLDNTAIRSRLCLHLEIIAGIDSPPEWTEERMAFQVARLTGRMRDGTDDPLSHANALELEKNWYLTGSAPPPQAESLEARFQAIKQVLTGATHH